MADEDQDRILEDHIQVVREQAFQMKKSLDQNNLRDALKFSSTMLGEMKTSKLSPRNYFNLCKSTTEAERTTSYPCQIIRCAEFSFLLTLVENIAFILISPPFRYDGIRRACSFRVTFH